MSYLLKFLFPLQAVLLLSSFICAYGGGSVELLGPGDADMVSSISFSSDGNTIFVGTDIGGIYYTIDEGKNWSSCNRGLKNYDVSTPVLQSPIEEKTFWVGTRGGIYKSIDAAKNWSAMWHGLAGPAKYKISTPVGAIAIDPVGSTTIYMGMGCRPDQMKSEVRTFVRTVMNGCLYKSTDLGKSWFVQSVISTNCFIRSLIVLSGTPKEILAATDAGIFRSKDEGKSWLKVLDGDARCIVCCDEILYASVANVGVFKSFDNGHHWQSLNAGLPSGSGQNYSVIACAGKDIWVLNSTWALSGGAYVLKPGKSNWSKAPAESFPAAWLQPSRRFNAIAVNPSNSMHIVIGSSRYVYQSKDGGITWAQLISSPSAQGWTNTGLNVFGNALSLAVNPSQPQTIYFGTADHGLVVSHDGGCSWKPSCNGMTYQSDIIDIVVSGNDDQNVFAICSDKLNQAIVRSQNAGVSWLDISSNLFSNQKLMGLCQAYRDGKNILFLASDAAVYSSDDNGENWKQTGNLYASAKFVKLYWDAFRGALFLANDFGLYRLDPDGIWNMLTPGSIYKVTAIYCDQERIIIGTRRSSGRGGAVYVSNNNGRTWQTGQSGYVWISSIIRCQDKYIASTNIDNYCDESCGQGLWVSGDGFKWDQFVIDLPVNRITKMAIDPSNDKVIYLCLSGAGLVRMTF